MSVGLGLGK